MLTDEQVAILEAEAHELQLAVNSFDQRRGWGMFVAALDRGNAIDLSHLRQGIHEYRHTFPCGLMDLESISQAVQLERRVRKLKMSLPGLQSNYPKWRATTDEIEELSIEIRRLESLVRDSRDAGLATGDDLPVEDQ